MKFTYEQIIKAQQAKSAEELLAIAKENGFEMTSEQAKQYFAELNKQGELTDDELVAVAGGNKDNEPVQQEEKHAPAKFKEGASVWCGTDWYVVSSAYWISSEQKWKYDLTRNDFNGSHIVSVYEESIYDHVPAQYL